MDPLAQLVRALHTSSVRSVLIGVAGANYYEEGGATIFATEDRVLFLPPEPDNLVRCWTACEAVGLDLRSGDEPLDTPRDAWLAERIIAQRATVTTGDRRALTSICRS